MQDVNQAGKARKSTYVGLFMVTLGSLMYEILLTRIFSVSMWYHFAFVAMSVALFGMTVGAIIVYLLPGFFTQDRTSYHLALSSLLFGLFIIISFLTHLSIPVATDMSVVSIVGVYSLALTCVVISVPFIFSGICVCLALTRFPRQVSRLYSADLAGAALGCILLIFVLRITDGPTAVMVVALIVSIGAVFFAAGGGHKKLTRVVLMFGLLLAVFVVGNTVLVSRQASLLRLLWVKGEIEERPLYEKWNSFSRVAVSGNPDRLQEPLGWGLSPLSPEDQRVRRLTMYIDAWALTVLTGFQGDLNDLEYLKYDVTNIVHYIRPDSKVLAIGPGGGRDILSALAFEQESVVGVEINKEIIDATNQRFGDFTGHLDRYPGVTFVVDEARSYIARQADNYDIIQISLIDTFAATAAGAFVLSENSLYTVEGWEVFLNHLTPGGVLTVSRWYFAEMPGQMYRLTSLASATLLELGVENPRDHIVIVRYMPAGGDAPYRNGVGTILVSREPFSDEDLAIIDQVAGRMQFDVVLSPEFALDTAFETIASGKDIDTFMASFPLNVEAPTDDSPFFFQMLRLRDIFRRELWEQGANRSNIAAVVVLGTLLIAVVTLASLCIIVPLVLTTKKGMLAKGALPLFVFFAGIGCGFMLIEISQMQRLIVFLGHPTYGLSVVLFALLLSSGLGSYSTRGIPSPGLAGSAVVRLLLLLCVLVGFGALTPFATRVFQGETTLVRILVAIGTLFPLGLFMGMAFPLGMKMASTKSASLTPWLWGINGAISVCASVLAIAIALTSGISATFWTGFSCYVVAFVAFVWADRLRGTTKGYGVQT